MIEIPPTPPLIALISSKPCPLRTNCIQIVFPPAPSLFYSSLLPHNLICYGCHLCLDSFPPPPLFPLFPVLFHLHILVTNFVLSTNTRPILHTGKAVKQEFSLESEPVQTYARQNMYFQRQCFFFSQSKEGSLPWRNDLELCPLP